MNPLTSGKGLEEQALVEHNNEQKRSRTTNTEEELNEDVLDEHSIFK